MVATRQASKKKPRTYSRLPRDAQAEGPRHRPDRYSGPLARASDDRRRAGRARRVRPEADQRRYRRGRGDARRGAEVQARGAGGHTTPQHAPPDGGARSDHQRRKARKDRRCRDLLLLPHASARESARHRAAGISRLRDVDRPCADAPVQLTGASALAGAHSWNTATALSAICASTCSTWCAG